MKQYYLSHLKELEAEANRHLSAIDEFLQKTVP